MLKHTSGLTVDQRAINPLARGLSQPLGPLIVRRSNGGAERRCRRYNSMSSVRAQRWPSRASLEPQDIGAQIRTGPKLKPVVKASYCRSEWILRLMLIETTLSYQPIIRPSVDDELLDIVAHRDDGCVRYARGVGDPHSGL
jgi:hypothetical protein